VLLYDQLVIPVPSDPTEVDRWQQRGRKPELQAELLAILGDDVTLPVPWTLARHAEWAARYGSPSERAREASVRDEVAKAVAFDADNVEMARRSAAAVATVVDPDDPGYMMTRMVLAEEFGSAGDRKLVDRIPRLEDVETVVAYGSYSDFAMERGHLDDRSVAGAQPVYKFEWSFFVPEDSDLSDKELLRRAVELAHTDAVPSWRAALQRWRNKSMLSGQTDADALAEMEAMIGEYREAARKLKMKTVVRTGVAVVAVAVGGAAAVAFPPAGLTALFGLASLKSPEPIPRQLEAAAVFHEARHRFR
jgi:hypothetical protein